MADVTTARRGLAGHKRVRAEIGAGSSAGSDAAVYRTFPARLPLVLTAAAGILAALGSLGAVIRSTALASARDDPTQAGVIMGYRQAGGWVVAVLGLALLMASFAWATRRGTLKLAATGIAIALGVLIGVRLASFDARAHTLADAARRAPSFVGFHAGFGWGAWCMLLGAILAAFGLIIGALRALDLRKGIPE